MLRFSKTAERTGDNDYIIWRDSSFATDYFRKSFPFTAYPCKLLFIVFGLGVFWQTHRHWVQ